MNTKWLKEATHEELLAQLEAGFQHLNNTEIFTTEHREIYNEVKLIKEEILIRMKRAIL